MKLEVLAVKMEVGSFSLTLTICLSSWLHIPEDLDLLHSY